MTHKKLLTSHLLLLGPKYNYFRGNVQDIWFLFSVFICFLSLCFLFRLFFFSFFFVLADLSVATSPQHLLLSLSLTAPPFSPFSFQHKMCTGILKDKTTLKIKEQKYSYAKTGPAAHNHTNTTNTNTHTHTHTHAKVHSRSYRQKSPHGCRGRHTWGNTAGSCPLPLCHLWTLLVTHHRCWVIQPSCRHCFLLQWCHHRPLTWTTKSDMEGRRQGGWSACPGQGTPDETTDACGPHMLLQSIDLLEI